MHPLMVTVSQINQGWQKTGESFPASRGRNQQQRRRIGAVQHLLLMRMDRPAFAGKPMVKFGGQGVHAG